MSPQDRYFTFDDVRRRLQLWGIDSNALGRMLDRWARKRGIEQRWSSEQKTFANPSVDCRQTVRRYPYALFDDCCEWVKGELAAEIEFQKRQGDLFA